MATFRNDKHNFALRSRWHCDIPDLDMNSWLFGSATTTLPTIPIFYSATSPETHAYSMATYRSLVQRLARGLLRFGFQSDDRLLVFSGNSVFFPVLFMGPIAAGGVFTGANPTYTSRELAFQLKNSGARFLIVNEVALETGIKAADEVGMKREDIFVFDEGLLIAKAQGGVDRWASDGKRHKEQYGVRHWSELLDVPAEAWQWPVLNTREAVNKTATINYSSGTTGVPKGVEITHRNYVSNILQAVVTTRLSPGLYALDRRWVGILPMYHAFGQTYYTMLAPYMDVPVYFLSKFDFQLFLETIQKFKITSLAAVPPIMVALAKHPIVKDYDLTSVRSMGSGAAPLSGDILKEALSRLGGDAKITQGWGMTELTCSVLGHHPDADDDPQSVGELMPNCEGKVVDAETGAQELPAYARGEILIRSPNACKGYFRNPEATSELYTSDGFLRTGDIGYYNSQGLWYIVDRKKELIKVKGNQVAPAELEGILLENPAIQDSAVIGVPHDGDERVRAYVVPVPNHHPPLTENDVQDWIKERCAKHKWLTGGVVFIETVPKTASGKIMRKALREQAQEEMIGVRAKL